MCVFRDIENSTCLSQDLGYKCVLRVIMVMIKIFFGKNAIMRKKNEGHIFTRSWDKSISKVGNFWDTNLSCLQERNVSLGHKMWCIIQIFLKFGHLRYYYYKIHKIPTFLDFGSKMGYKCVLFAEKYSTLGTSGWSIKQL